MTTRVVELQPARTLKAAAQARRLSDAGSRGVDVRSAALVALLVAPVAGAGEAPAGWLVAAGTAVVLLGAGLVAGGRVPWVWLALVAAGIGVFVPRGPFALIGPVLFVTTAVCLAVWLSNRDRASRRERDRPRNGSRERAAQVLMGLTGERHVGQVLASELPEDYTLINGLKLPRGAGDIDHLVIGPTGLFLLETKTMAGQIVCEPDGTWRRKRVGRAGTAYTAYIGDPASQVQRNIFAVRQALRRRLPTLLQSSVWIEGLVVFPHPNTQLETRHSRVPAVLLTETTRRICEHAPRRRLRRSEVDSVVAALLDEGRSNRFALFRQSAQALMELALMLPLVLALVFGVVALSRVIQAHTAVIAVAHEAARAGALANSPADAPARMQARATLVARGLGLDPAQVTLHWDLTRFAQSPGEVAAHVAYPVDLADLPLAGALGRPVVSADHIEWVDPYRSGLQTPAESLQ